MHNIKPPYYKWHRSNKDSELEKLNLFKKRIAASVNELYRAFELEVMIRDVDINWRVINTYNACLEALKLEDYKALQSNLRKIQRLLGKVSFEVLPYIKDDEDISMIGNAFSIPLNDKNTLGCYDFGKFNQGDIKVVIRKVYESRELLKQFSPVYFNRVEQLLETMVVVGRNAEGKGIRSGSTIVNFGCIINRPNKSGNVLQYIEDFVHESTHHMVYLEQHDDNLVNNETKTLYAAPFRDDLEKRPMATQFHSALVLGNVAICLGEISQNYLGKREVIIGIEIKIKQMLEWFSFCCQTIDTYGDLTMRGWEMIGEIKANVNERFNEQIIN